MSIGLVGGIVGSLVGVTGGLIGTYFSVKRTNGPREKAFVIRAATVCWIGLSVLIAGVVLLPQARIWFWILYGILLPLGIQHCNRRQVAIRREEQAKS